MNKKPPEPKQRASYIFCLRRYFSRLKILLREDSVEDTPAVEVVSWVAEPAAAAAAAAVIAEVSTFESDFKAEMTLAALELLTRFDEPLMRPDVKLSVKALVASVNELAPVRIFPRLMMLVTLLRSIEPEDLKI